MEAWIAGLPADERRRATGFFTTVRRTPPGSPQPFVVVPYSLEYQGELARAAELLREAAAQTAQPTLKRFLETRAAAFISNDYYESDVAWMELDASIEPTIGPYEVYQDQWFNYKAAFESFITVRDEAESDKLARFSSELQEIENHLPIDPALRNPSLGALAPIRVVNEIFAAGDANRGVQTAAFNLPNDERVVKAKGTKRVMLKNVQEAKFRIVLLPISKVALAPADQANVVFDAFFTHILMHELMHGLGPHNIRVGGPRDDRAAGAQGDLQRDRRGQGGRVRAVGAAVPRGQGFVAEHNAGDDVHDVSGIGVPIDPLRRERGARAGNGDPVERACWTPARSAWRPTARSASMRAGSARRVTALTRDLMTLQAAGDYAKAQGLIERLGVLRPEVKRVLDRLTAVPVDIEPRFPTAEQLERES